MEKVKISSLISAKISGEWGDDTLTDDAVNVIRTANFANSGTITFHNIVKREIDQKKVDQKKLVDGDVIIEKSGGSPNQPVGRVVFFENPDNSTYLSNNFTTILRPNKSKVNPKYLFYLLYNFYQTGEVSSFQNKTTGIINLKLDRYLDSEITYEPDLETQNKIVAILDKGKTILDKRGETIKKYDELLRAVFLEMFGDPVLNPNGWETKSLLEYGDFKNGLNYKSQESGIDVLNLGVGDFKSHSEIRDVNKLSKISLERTPSKDYFLNNNDLVFVRSNGNKQLVGRCVLVKPGQEKVTFSGFCIRYRLKKSGLSPFYLSHLFRVPTFKRYMLQNGRGANIQNINQELLGNLNVPIPSIELQLEFEKRLNLLRIVIGKVESFRSKSEELLKSLLQQVFSERIIIDVEAELEALINAISIEKKDEENKIDTVRNDLTFLQRLIDKLKEQDFESSNQYEKAKYIAFRIMKEEPNLIKQEFNAQEKKMKLLL